MLVYRISKLSTILRFNFNSKAEIVSPSGTTQHFTHLPKNNMEELAKKKREREEKKRINDIMVELIN